MSSEQQAREQKRLKLLPADKTDQPHHVRDAKLSTLFDEEPLCVAPSTPLAEAVRRMNECQSRCAVVCDASGRVVGLLTERDLLTKVVGEQVDLSAPVERFTSEPLTLTREASVGNAVRLMSEHGGLHVIVTEDNKFVGLISINDVITCLAESYPKEVTNLPPVPAQVMDTPEGE